MNNLKALLAEKLEPNAMEANLAAVKKSQTNAIFLSGTKDFSRLYRQSMFNVISNNHTTSAHKKKSWSSLSKCDQCDNEFLPQSKMEEVYEKGKTEIRPVK